MASLLMQAGRERSSTGLFHLAVLAFALSFSMDATHAVQWTVGGDVQKWSFLHANDALTFFNDWANNISFKTGDTLLFEYDNTTHNVLQLAAEADFASCTSTPPPFNAWNSGSDVVFMPKAGKFYFVCGAPMHCLQGMKVAIKVSGPSVAAPMALPPLAAIAPPAGPDANSAGQAPVATFTWVSSLIFALAILWWRDILVHP